MLSVVWFFFTAITVASAIVDVATYRIPNAFVFALAGLFLVVAIGHHSEVAWLSHFGAATMVLGAGIFIYALGQMGAGDVKLLAVLALWAGIIPLVAMLFWVSLCALAGMLTIIVLRSLVPRLQSAAFLPKDLALPTVLLKGRAIPYAIGIAPGAIIASFGFPSWLWSV